MCVWQSQAPAGTSKFTAVAGWEAFASARRGPKAAARAPIRISRRFGMAAPSSELIAAQAPVHGDHRASDVAGARRGEEANQVGDVVRLAVLADRNFLLALLLAVLRRIVAQDLLGHDAPGRNGIDSDAVLAHLARQALGPRMHRRLRAERAVDAFGLRLAGDVDDAAPVARHHLLKQLVGELALAREVERQRLFPLLFARVERELAAAAGVIHQDVDRAQALQRRLGDLLRRVLLHEVALDDDQRRLELLLEFFQEIPPPGYDGKSNPFFRKRRGNAAADTDAGASD